MTAGERLKVARELRGLTQTALAESLDVSQSAISFAERGRLEPSEELLSAAALKLGFPISFFRRDSHGSFPLGSLLLYRARKSLTSSQESQSRRWAQVMFECTQTLSKRVRTIQFRVPQLSEPPEVAAAITRDSLGLAPEEPVPHFVRALERAGTTVLALPLDLSKIDAFSVWAAEDSGTPVIALMHGRPGDRLRWSTAHELGHLVLHRSIRGSVRDVEDEANAFAAELLMPEDAMLDELESPLTLNALAGLKARWGVSMQALIMRAADLEIITPRQKKYLFMKFSKAGWRKREPVEVPVERPLAFRRMVELLFGAPIDTRRVAGNLNIPEQMLIEFLALQEGSAFRATEGKRRESGEIVPFPRQPPV